MSQVSFAVRWENFLLSLLFLGGTPALAGTTPAGTTLTTTAQVTYNDNGPRSVESAPVSVTVAPRAAAAVALESPAATVSGTRAIACTLTNTSNYPNGIRTTVTMASNTYAYLVYDANGDGVWQPTETNMLRSLPSMESNASVRCFLLVRAMPGVPNGATGGATVFVAPVDEPAKEVSVRFTPTYVASKLAPQFVYTVPEPIVSSPTVMNGLAVVGSESGVVYAIRAKGDGAGTLAWRYPATGSLGAPVRGRAVADATGYYFTANDGYLYKVSLTGQSVWKTSVAPAGTPMEAMPILSPTEVTIACGDGRVRCIDKHTGEIVNSSPSVGDGALGTPSMPRDGDLWVGGSDGYLYNMKMGESFTILSAHAISRQPMSATPFVDMRDGLVLSVSEEGNVYAMKVRSDLVVWGPRSLGSQVKGSPWVDSSAGIVYILTVNGALHALNVKDGVPVGGYPVQLSATGGFVGSPVVVSMANNLTTAFAGSTSGKFYAANLAVPGRVASFDTGDPAAQFQGAPALSGPTANDTIVVAATNGKVYGFSVRSAVEAP